MNGSPLLVRSQFLAGMVLTLAAAMIALVSFLVGREMPSAATCVSRLIPRAKPESG